MNTKDNQEAELLRLDDLLKIKEACEKALAPIGNMSDAPVLNALRKGMEFHNAMWPQQILNLVNEVLDLRATPQVNEEVAIKIPKDSEQIREFIGSQYCSLEYGDKVNHSPNDDDTYTLTAHDLLSAFSMAVDCAEPLPTPSPYNVLVEALRGAQELIGKHSSDESEEGWLYIDAYKSIEKILATYSSTDSVSISTSEYEVMKSDAERYRWLRDEGGYGMDEPCIYADDDCNTWLRGEQADKAIDTARKEY